MTQVFYYGNYKRIFWILLILLVITSDNITIGGIQRCFNLCSRSEQGIGCRRCRFREPLRFGKRSQLNNDMDEQTMTLYYPLIRYLTNGYMDTINELDDKNVENRENKHLFETG